MKIFNTALLQPNDKFSTNHASWIYNGLDCCVTLEIQQRLRADLAKEPENVQATYRTALEKLAPVNYMSITGLRVDAAAKARLINQYKSELRQYESRFDQMMDAVFGYTINWRSHIQLKWLFYDCFQLKAVRKRNAKGQMMPTVNADALERFTIYLYPQVFARYLLAMRDLGKKISFLETEIDPDGFMRTMLNIAGTDTGRFSSKFSAFGSGSNLQNVEDRLREVFISDPGYIYVNVDLEQADARNVGARIYSVFYESHGAEAAGRYLDACESGDLHTQVCRMVWPDLAWTGDLKADKEVAEQPFYNSSSYRDMAKKLGHGTNYFGLPHTMAMHTKVETYIIEAFQRAYFAAFPLIGNIKKDLTQDDWHGWVYRELQRTSTLTNLFGRRRIFFDRPTEMTTLRAAIAYDPQSNTGEDLDRGWLRLWPEMPEVKLKMPVHDSILFQIPREMLEEAMPRILELMRVEIELPGGRKFSVPLDAAVGWNWAKSKFNKKSGLWENPFGLRKWTGKEERHAPKATNRLSYHLGKLG